MGIKWVNNPRVREIKKFYKVKIWRRKHGEEDVIFISLWDDVAKAVAKKRYVRLGIDGDRIYFALFGVPRDGTFKAADYSTDAFVIRVPIRVEPTIDAFCGVYSDVLADGELLYIEKEKCDGEE